MLGLTLSCSSRGFDKCQMISIKMGIPGSYRTVSLPLKCLVLPCSLLLPPLKLLATTDLTVCSFVFSRMSHSWNHVVCSLFNLVSLT